jgi:predicted transcriptional regulator
MVKGSRLSFVDSDVSVYTTRSIPPELAKSPESEDRPGELFFQLSNVDRRRILEEATRGSLKLNEAARKLNLSPTETFRHLQRLTEGGLLVKLPDSKYGMTAYARLVLDSCSSLDFASRYREFFTDHDASRLPPEFRNRLGELSGGVLSTDSVASLNKLAEMFRDAKERIDLLVDVRYGVYDEITQRRVSEGVKLRVLTKETSMQEYKTLPRSSWVSGEYRVLREHCAVMGITEREAAVTLPLADGKFETVGFYGNDASFLKWAGDLFRDQWEKAKPWYP